MGNTAQRTAHIMDTIDFFHAVDDGTLPAVSFVKPDSLLDGHPASSKEDLFEAMVKKIMDHLTANKDLFGSTALMITMDESGGYYDSGYIQPLDFFDGPRIPLIVISPFTKGRHVSHVYADHVSILKFIERNWHLQPLTARSRDNFPNPRADEDNPYVPKNSPAISDLFDFFQKDHDRGGNGIALSISREHSPCSPRALAAFVACLHLHEPKSPTGRVSSFQLKNSQMLGRS